MAKIRNPQEFFEVFKLSAQAEKADSPAAPKPEPDRPAPEAPKPVAMPAAATGGVFSAPRATAPSAPKRNAEVLVTPGRITVTLSHTGVVILVAFVAGISIFSFCLGARYSTRSSYVPHKVEETAAPPAVTDGREVSLDNLSVHNMTPATPKSAEPGSPQTPAAPKPTAPKKPYWLQLVSGISKDKADALATTLAVNWQTEVVKAGKTTYGVRIGSWESPEDVNARRALTHFKPQKQYKDCYFIKVDTR